MGGRSVGKTEKERRDGRSSLSVCAKDSPQSHMGRVCSSAPDTFLHRDFTLPSRITHTHKLALLSSIKFILLYSSTLFFNYRSLSLSLYNHTVNENKWLSVYTPVSGRGETLPGNGCQQHTEPVTSAPGEVGGNF